MSVSSVLSQLSIMIDINSKIRNFLNAYNNKKACLSKVVGQELNFKCLKHIYVIQYPTKISTWVQWHFDFYNLVKFPRTDTKGHVSWDHESMQTPHIPACSTAAPSPVLLQSPQISCSALSSVWHIWYLANSAVILQWIDSVPSAQCPVCDAVQCFETFSKTFLAALAGRRGGRGAAADRQ